jgi:capsular exopolysaccharide synthesis family protein
VSKFFKALENAEREREAETKSVTTPPAAEAAAPTEAPPPPPPVERPARSFFRRPASQEPGVSPAAAPVERAAAPVERTAAPVGRAESPTRVEAEPSVPAAPVGRADAPVGRADAPVGHAPIYGAPVMRNNATHERAFDGVLPPAAISEPGELDDHLVSLLEPTSAAAEQYRTIRLHIENLHRERGVGLVAISSPARGDGKTISAINLAGALAQSPDARVALLEADVRHPGVARYLGLAGPRGLSTYLLDHTMPVDGVVERPTGVGFAVIVAGPVSSMPYELLKSPRLGALVTALRERFDYVVVDTPPVLPFPDVGIVRDLVDGFLLVVRANRTPREMVRDSLTTLGPDRVLGVVFNDDERVASVARRDEDDGWRGVFARPLGGTRAA